MHQPDQLPFLTQSLSLHHVVVTRASFVTVIVGGPPPVIPPRGYYRPGEMTKFGSSLFGHDINLHSMH